MKSKSYADIFDQASTVPATIDLLARTEVPAVATRPGRTFVFTGCGSSYYVAQCGARLLRALSGVSASAAPASEVWLLPDLWLDENTVLVAISRTGTTTEVLRALECARERGIPAITISLAVDVPMHELSDVSLTLTHVREAGRVMLQSFANMLIAVQWLAANVARTAGSSRAAAYLQGFPGVADALSDLLPTFDRDAQAIVEQGVGQYVFLGSGPLTGVCAESVLKVQEMAQVPAESYAGLEYRHGPIATLTNRSFVACVSCARTVAFDMLLAGDVQFLGGTPLMIGPEDCLRTAPAGVRTIGLPTGLPDWLYGNVALPFFQLLAYHQTIKQGENPDSVRLLDRTIDPHINPHDVDLKIATPAPV